VATGLIGPNEPEPVGSERGEARAQPGRAPGGGGKDWAAWWTGQIFLVLLALSTSP